MHPLGRVQMHLLRALCECGLDALANHLWKGLAISRFKRYRFEQDGLDAPVLARLHDQPGSSHLLAQCVLLELCFPRSLGRHLSTEMAGQSEREMMAHVRDLDGGASQLQAHVDAIAKSEIAQIIKDPEQAAAFFGRPTAQLAMRPCKKVLQSLLEHLPGATLTISQRDVPYIKAGPINIAWFESSATFRVFETLPGIREQRKTTLSTSESVIALVTELLRAANPQPTRRFAP